MKQFLQTKKKYIWVAIFSIVTCFFFFTVPAFAASDEEIKNVLIENYDIFQNNNIFVSAIRWIGWLLISCLSWIGASCAELFDKAFLFVDFTQDPQIKEYIETFDLVFTALICLSLVSLGIILIFWHEKKPKIAMNILIAVLVVSSGSEILYQMNQFLAEDVRGQILGTEENTSADLVYEMVGSSVYDLKQMDRDVGLMNITTENRTTLPKLSKRDIDLIDINEILKPEDVGDDAKDLMEQRLDVYAGEEAEKAQLKEIYNGVAWTDLLNEYYYRYNVNWVLCIVGIVATIIVYICMAYKVVRILYEIVIHQIMAILYSANLSNSQKTLKILDGIKDSYITLILVLICVKIYHIAYYFINNLNVGGFTKAFLLLFVAFAVADGPNIIQKITGIDAGLSSEFGKFFAMMQATRVVRDVTRGIARGTSKIGEAIGNATGRERASDAFEPNADYQRGVGEDGMSFQNDPNDSKGSNDPNRPNDPGDPNLGSFGSKGEASNNPFNTVDGMGNVPPDPSSKADFHKDNLGGDHTVHAGDKNSFKDAAFGAAVGASLAGQGKGGNQTKENPHMTSTKEKEGTQQKQNMQQKQGTGFQDGSSYNPEKDSQAPYEGEKKSAVLSDTVDDRGLGTQPYDADLDRMEEELGDGFHAMEDETLGSDMPIYAGSFMDDQENAGISGETMDDLASVENGFSDDSLGEVASDSLAEDLVQEPSETLESMSTGAEDIGSFVDPGVEESGIVSPGTEISGTDTVGEEISGSEMFESNMPESESIGSETFGSEVPGSEAIRSETVGSDISGSNMQGLDFAQEENPKAPIADEAVMNSTLGVSSEIEQSKGGINSTGSQLEKEPLKEGKAKIESDPAGIQKTGVNGEHSLSGKMESQMSGTTEHPTHEQHTVKQETSSKSAAFEKQKEIGAVGTTTPVGGDQIAKKQAFDTKPPIQATEKVIEKQAPVKASISKEQPMKKDISGKEKNGRSRKGKAKKSDLL